jgi:hypothetical protein
MYLQQAEYALSRRLVGYDPLLCTPAGVPRVASVAMGSVTIVADSTAGLIVATPARGQPVLAVVVLGAKGWTVADVACRQP